MHTIFPTALDDNALIKMALSGENECFEVLMDRHLAALKKCIGAMVRNRTDADDLVQDVLLKVWDRLSTFRFQASFRTWMTRVAINEVLQSYRRERRNPLGQVRGDLDGLASAGESPYRSLIRVEATMAVRNALARLPKRYSEVLILRDLDQLTTEEAAQSLQETIPTVKTRLFRARLMLLAALQGLNVRSLASAARKSPLRKAA